jgi:hypothetical protein
MINQMRETLTEFLRSLMEGSKFSLQLLDFIISDGGMVNPAVMEAVGMMKDWERVTYSFLIPAAWSVRGNTPVIFPTDKNCDDVDGAKNALEDHMSGEDVDRGKACFDGKLYVIADPSGDSVECAAGPPNGGQFGLNQLPGKGCEQRKFSLPPSWDKFGPEMADLKLEDIAKA